MEIRQQWFVCGKLYFSCCCGFLLFRRGCHFSWQSFSVARDTYMYTFLKECGHTWARPLQNVVWVIRCRNGPRCVRGVHSHLDSQSCPLVWSPISNRSERGLCSTFTCLFYHSTVYFWCSALKLKVACGPYWQEKNKKVESMSNGGKKNSGNIFKEGLVILGGLLWADVRFDVTERPQDSQCPLMLPARYFCQCSVFRAGHPMWCSCLWLKSTVVCRTEQQWSKWSETANNNIRWRTRIFNCDPFRETQKRLLFRSISRRFKWYHWICRVFKR